MVIQKDYQKIYYVAAKVYLAAFLADLEAFHLLVAKTS
jgi:hypothetical protein